MASASPGTSGPQRPCPGCTYGVFLPSLIPNLRLSSSLVALPERKQRWGGLALGRTLGLPGMREAKVRAGQAGLCEQLCSQGKG